MDGGDKIQTCRRRTVDDEDEADGDGGEACELESVPRRGMAVSGW